MYNLIKNFLKEGGRCLLIENDKPIGVILTIEEYELLRSKEMNFPQASAEIADIESADDVTLEDLGVDELPY